MKQNTRRVARRSENDKAQSRWIRVAYDDASGIDGDIETLLDRVQRMKGSMRDEAYTDLVRSLSYANGAS